MAIVDRHIAEPGLGPTVLNLCLPMVLGSHKVGASNAVVTTAPGTSSLNATKAVGTNIDFPRNLSYQMSITNGSASSAMVSQGTLVMNGFDAQGNALSESVGIKALAGAGTAGIIGTAIFGSLASNGVSFSQYQLHTGSSSASDSVSVYVGVGNIVGLPMAIRSTNAVPYAWIGTTPQPASYTVKTGPVGTAGISFSNALASNTPVQARVCISR